MTKEATICESYAGQPWGRLKVHGGASGWTLDASTPASARDEPPFVEAAFAGVVPQVHVSGSNVELTNSRWTAWARSQSGHIHLSPSIPWAVVIAGGVSRLEADLQALKLSEFRVLGGVSRLVLKLGMPTQRVPICIHGGVERLTILRPRGAQVAVHVSGGSTRLELDGMALGSVAGPLRWQSLDEPNDGFYDVEIHGGSSRLSIGPGESALRSPSEPRGATAGEVSLLDCSPGA